MWKYILMAFLVLAALIAHWWGLEDVDLDFTEGEL